MKKLAILFAALLAYAGLALAAVNINTATKAELESLDGIGPVKARPSSTTAPRTAISSPSTT